MGWSEILWLACFTSNDWSVWFRDVSAVFFFVCCCSPTATVWLAGPLNYFCPWCLYRLLVESLSCFLSTQPTATIRLKPVAKVKEPRASHQVLTPLAPPVQVHTGETTVLHLISLLTGGPWSRSMLHVPLPPRHGQVDLRTLLFPPSLTLLQHVHCSHGRHETAQNPATLILSGECVSVHDWYHGMKLISRVTRHTLMFFFAQRLADRHGQHTHNEGSIHTTNAHARKPQITPEQIYLIWGDIALRNPSHTTAL